MRTPIASFLSLLALNLSSIAPGSLEISTAGKAAAVGLAAALGGRLEVCEQRHRFDATWLCIRTPQNLETAKLSIAGVQVAGLRQTDAWDDDNSTHFTLGGSSLYSAGLVSGARGRVLIWHEVRR